MYLVYVYQIPHIMNHYGKSLMLVSQPSVTMMIHLGDYFEMALSASVNFISLVTSRVGLQEEDSQTAIPHVSYLGVSF